MQEPITSAQLDAGDIDIVAPPAGLSEAPESYIHRLLARPRQAFEHGAAYTGRPATWLYQNAHHVIKIRSEYRFGARDAGRWIERAVRIERRLGAHHPDKGWFLVHCGAVSWIGNLTPFMRPLHQEAKHMTAEALCGSLERMLALYLRTAADCKQRLDEGLSNFAIAADGLLYYIDDDVYAWDAFISLTQAIGFLVSRNAATDRRRRRLSRSGIAAPLSAIFFTTATRSAWSPISFAARRSSMLNKKNAAALS